MLTQSTEMYQEVLQVAENLYRQDPDWVTFFREVLGIDGAIRKSFPGFEELTPAYPESLDCRRQDVLRIRTDAGLTGIGMSEIGRRLMRDPLSLTKLLEVIKSN